MNRSIEYHQFADMLRNFINFWKAEVLAQKHEVNDAIRLFEKALELVKKGHVKTDNYMEVFDMPNQMQIEDRIQMLMEGKN